MSQALNAFDRRVDEKRVNHPISGTKIRADLHRYKAYLAPCVLESLMEYKEKNLEKKNGKKIN